MDNSVDEALAGACDRIEITINADNSVTVADNGRGIPVGPHPTQKRPDGEPMDALEVVKTILHAGGKFGGGGYKVASGLHGVGVSAVNALSEWLEVEVRRDGKVYRQRYEQGRPVTPVEVVGKSKAKETGTRTTFMADAEIFRPGLQIRCADAALPGDGVPDPGVDHPLCRQPRRTRQARQPGDVLLF